jgi:heavy-metal exporter, HME family
VLKVTLYTSLRHRIAVLACAGLLMIAGVLLGRTLDIDVLPDINRPSLTIMVESQGLATEEVESLVTRPLELSLAGMPGVTRMRTTSDVGLSIVTLDLAWGADLVTARQQAAERLGAAASQLPAGIVPQIQPISSIMGEIMLVALTAEHNSSPRDLRTLADWVVRPRLLSVPGVAQVTVIGGEVRQFRIAPRLAMLAGLNISLADLERAAARFGVNAGGGLVADAGTEFTIRAVAARTDAAALAKTVVAVRDGVPVLLSQLAEVDEAAKPSRGSAGFDGQDAVILSVQKQPKADTRAVTALVSDAIKDMQSSLSDRTRIHVAFQQADFINSGLTNVRDALIAAIAIVAVVLFVFLGNVRATFISLLAIPLSVLVAILSFRAFDISINTMSLGGLAIAVGELVDDAVVGVENVIRRLRQNRTSSQPRSAFEVVFRASEEVRSGILYATVIIVLVFAPLLMLEGVEGRLFSSLAISYMVALTASLATAITVTPVLCLLLLPQSRGIAGGETLILRTLKRGLSRALQWALAHPGPVMAIPAAALVVTAALLLDMPRSLMPPFNEGSLTVEVSARPGITLAESSYLGALTERLVKEMPDVLSVGRRTGRAELDEHAQGVQVTELDVRLKEHSRSHNEIVADLRGRLAILPASVNIGQPISHRIDHLFSGVRAQIAVKVFGPDIENDLRIAEGLRGQLAGIPGLIDVQTERRLLIPSIQVKPDEQRAILFGVSPATLVDTVQTWVGGKTVSVIPDTLGRTEVALRLSDPERTSHSLSALLVETPQGYVPLGNVATVSETTGYSQIDRENGQRRVAVYANTQGADISSTVDSIRRVIDQTALPSGYFVALEGTFAGQQQAAERITLLSAMSAALIFLLLLGRYRSTVLVAIVMLNVPLALIGGVIALVIAGLPLSLASVVGFITVAAISVRNGILKISHYLNLHLYEDEAFGRELVMRGTLERLSPVLMTASAASLGVVPLLIDPAAAGREILYPVAVIVFGGLISATVLDTFLTPLLFLEYGSKAAERLRLRRTLRDHAPL